MSMMSTAGSVGSRSTSASDQILSHPQQQQTTTQSTVRVAGKLSESHVGIQQQKINAPNPAPSSSNSAGAVSNIPVYSKTAVLEVSKKEING